MYICCKLSIEKEFNILLMLSDANSASNMAHGQAGPRTGFGTAGFHIRWPRSEEDCCAVHWKNEVGVFLNYIR